MVQVRGAAVNVRHVHLKRRSISGPRQYSQQQQCVATTASNSETSRARGVFAAVGDSEDQGDAAKQPGEHERTRIRYSLKTKPHERSENGAQTRSGSVATLVSRPRQRPQQGSARGRSADPNRRTLRNRPRRPELPTDNVPREAHRDQAPNQPSTPAVSSRLTMSRNENGAHQSTTAFTQAPSRLLPHPAGPRGGPRLPEGCGIRPTTGAGTPLGCDFSASVRADKRRRSSVKSAFLV